MAKLKYTQRRGGMMATVYAPISLMESDVETLHKMAKERYGSRSKWREILRDMLSTGFTSESGEFFDSEEEVSA